MDEPFVIEKSDFVHYSVYHIVPLLVVALAGIILILIGRRIKSEHLRFKLLLLLSLIPAISVIMHIILKLVEGEFTVREDLPLHICRFAALLLPIVILKSNRYWLGIFYFWILAGTLNANITPDIEYNYPHWSYFSYWMLHSFLVIIPLYYIFVMSIKINFRDYKNAFWMANIFLVFTLIINYTLDSNYMYSLHKPQAGSLLDFLGPWPIYLITGQLLMGFFFFLLYIPFIQKNV